MIFRLSCLVSFYNKISQDFANYNNLVGQEYNNTGKVNYGNPE